VARYQQLCKVSVDGRFLRRRQSASHRPTLSLRPVLPTVYHSSLTILLFRNHNSSTALCPFSRILVDHQVCDRTPKFGIFKGVGEESEGAVKLAASFEAAGVTNAGIVSCGAIEWAYLP
jgi:hypothetical protein